MNFYTTLFSFYKQLQLFPLNNRLKITLTDSQFVKKSI